MATLNLKDVLGNQWTDGMPETINYDTSELERKLSDANKESAKRKAALKEKDEAFAQLQAQLDEQSAKYDALVLKNTITERTSSYVSAGYPAELASVMATSVASLSDEAFSTLLSTQTAHMKSIHDSYADKAAINTTEPAPSKGKIGTVIDTKGMSLDALQALYNTNPTAFTTGE